MRPRPIAIPTAIKSPLLTVFLCVPLCLLMVARLSAEPVPLRQMQIALNSVDSAMSSVWKGVSSEYPSRDEFETSTEHRARLDQWKKRRRDAVLEMFGNGPLRTAKADSLVLPRYDADEQEFRLVFSVATNASVKIVPEYRAFRLSDPSRIEGDVDGDILIYATLNVNRSTAKDWRLLDEPLNSSAKSEEKSEAQDSVSFKNLHLDISAMSEEEKSDFMEAYRQGTATWEKTKPAWRPTGVSMPAKRGGFSVEFEYQLLVEFEDEDPVIVVSLDKLRLSHASRLLFEIVREQD